MIKKQYQEPEITVTKFNIIDVILTSPMSESKDPANWGNEDGEESDGFFQ